MAHAGSSSQDKSKQLRKCPANPDTAYIRKDVLQKLADMLNESIPEYKRVDPKGFFVDNERSARFFVNDLTDISNRQNVSVGSCNDFIEGHVYHVAPFSYRLSFSHIVILENGRLKVFKSINCKNSEHRLADVIAYLEKRLGDASTKVEIFERVKNYRKYGTYFTVDSRHLDCEPAN